MKKISRVFSVFLAIIMVVSMLPVSVSAAAVTFTVTSSSTDIKVGDVVTVDVAISANSNINAITMDVVFDSNTLEYASHTVYGICGDEYVNKAYADGKIRFASAKGTAITADGIILTIQFNVLSSTCSDVAVDVVEAVDKDVKAVATSTQPVTLHSFGEWVTETEPLCEKAGQKSKSCSCGEKQYAEIDALGHDYSSDFTIDEEPTCTGVGSKSQHCSRCDSKISVTEISASGHSFGEWTVETESICEEKGKEKRICSVCGEVESQDIPAKGHIEEIIPAVAPTCTKTGLTEGVKCSVCEKILTTQTTVSATGHNYSEEITKIPTHTDNGERTFTCANCGDVYTEVIEADGEHKHIASVTTEPTCTEKGIMTYTCACGDNYSENIAALGHTEVTDDAVAPTCTATGLTEGSHCATCSEVFTAQIVLDALGHTVVVLPAVEPTCLTTGETEGSMCSVCDEILVPQYVIGAKGHSYADRVKEEPTCTDWGVGERYCVDCDFVQHVYRIDELGHTDEELDGKCDTCNETVCFCGCHKTGIAKFFWSIGNFFKKLFGNNAPCACGKPH